MTTTQKCAHPACNCQATSGKEHCSTTCAETKSPKAACDCKHTECDKAAVHKM